MVRERPPRLRLLRWLRSVLLMAQPPLLRKEGKTLGDSFTASMTAGTAGHRPLYKEHDYDNSSFAFIRSKAEGLDAITELRARRNQTSSDAREIFSRCAKSLV